MKDFSQLISIEEVFPESKFQQFRSFCKRKEIINIIDLTNDHLEEHYSWRGSSRDRKLNETKQRLKSLGKKFEKVVIEDDYELKNSDEPDGFSNMLPGLFKKNMTLVADERIASLIYRNIGNVGVSKDNMKQITIVELDESQE